MQRERDNLLLVVAGYLTTRKWLPPVRTEVTGVLYKVTTKRGNLGWFQLPLLTTQVQQGDISRYQPQVMCACETDEPYFQPYDRPPYWPGQTLIVSRAWKPPRS